MKEDDRLLENRPLDELLRCWHGSVWRAGIRPLLKRMQQDDLTMGELIVLHTLQHYQLTIAEVAETTFISQSAASRAVDRLVRVGWVRREENPDDRRQKRLTLTAEGAALVSEMEALRAERMARIFTVLDEDEREQLRRLLARLVRAFDETIDEFRDLDSAATKAHCPLRRQQPDPSMAGSLSVSAIEGKV